MVMKPSKQGLRGGNIKRNVRPGDYGPLKAIERQMEDEAKASRLSDPNEFSSQLRDPETGEKAYTLKQMRADEDLMRAKMKGRTRMPGAKPTLGLAKGGLVKGKKGRKRII